VKDGIYVPVMPITPNNLVDRRRTSIAKIDRSLLHCVWHEGEYRLDVWRETNGAHIELA
jgi:hypothetical protein